MDMRRTVRVGIAINNWMFLVAILVVVLAPLLLDLGARTRYTALDRAGAIKNDVLTTLPQEFGIQGSDTRNSVPRYIMGASTVVLVAVTLLWIALAFTNLVLWLHVEGRILGKRSASGLHLVNATEPAGTANGEGDGGSIGSGGDEPR